MDKEEFVTCIITLMPKRELVIHYKINEHILKKEFYL